MDGAKVPAHLPAARRGVRAVVVEEEEEVSLLRGGGGNCAAVLCTGCMDGLAEGAPLTVACLPACLPACQPSLVSLSASQPRTLPTFSTLTLQRAPDSQSKPSRVSTESKRTKHKPTGELNIAYILEQEARVGSLCSESRVVVVSSEAGSSTKIGSEFTKCSMV